MRPVDAKYEVSQTFGAFPTAGVVGNRNGTTVQRLVAQYGNYQPHGHAGEDIACPVGTPVRAIADGTVVWADWGTNLPGDETDAGYRRRWYLYKSFPGIVTVIQHDGWLSVYGHLSSNDAAPRGTRVREGELIGYSGDTGGVAPHLHVAAIVDTSYRTGGGLIYGCANPAPFYGNTTMTLQSQSMTVEPTPQEDELAFTISELLNHPAYDGGPTLSQVLKNLDDSEVTRYVKGDQSETLYDMTDDGKLRPIILAEWQATGRPYRTLPQVIINALEKTTA